MMDDLKLNKTSRGYVFSQLDNLVLDTNKTYRVSICEWREKRSLSQNAFQHVCYQEISKYLVSKGRTDWTPEVVKLNLKNKFLGWQTVDLVDVETGEVAQKDMIRSTAKLDVGESCHYTTQILAWASDIGCLIKVPENSDYFKYLQEQER